MWDNQIREDEFHTVKGRLKIRRKGNIKMDSTYEGRAVVDWIKGVRIGTTDMFCKHANEPSGSVKIEEGVQ